jgi:hypothetical protein
MRWPRIGAGAAVMVVGIALAVVLVIVGVATRWGMDIYGPAVAEWLRGLR